MLNLNICYFEKIHNPKIFSKFFSKRIVLALQKLYVVVLPILFIPLRTSHDIVPWYAYQWRKGDFAYASFLYWIQPWVIQLVLLNYEQFNKNYTMNVFISYPHLVLNVTSAVQFFNVSLYNQPIIS